MRKITLFLLCSLFILSTKTASAQDRFFAFTSQSNVIPKGTRSLELWYAKKSGGQVFFNGNYTRIGLKMGLGKNVLSAFYANLSTEALVPTEIDHTNKKVRMYGALTKTTDISFTNELKVKILDPVANPIGLAINNEITLGSQFMRITPRLILDKRVGRNFFDFNFLAEIEKRWESESNGDVMTTQAPVVTSEVEIPFELSMGYMRFLKGDKVGFGFEVRNHNEIFKGVGLEHSVVFLGPALHLQDDKWFFNITALSQLGNLHKSWIAPESKVLDEHQNFELRTSLGFIF